MEQATASHPQTPGAYPHAWRVLLLLFLANLLNFYDRVIPSIIVEPLRAAWALSDFQLGLTSTAFTTVYALSAIYFGKMADRRSRAKIMGWGLAVWSALTALSGAAWNFTSYLLIRMGVGVGEACYAPAATSMIGDIFPPEKKARAMGIFMLGLPLGILLSFSTVGYVVAAFDSWRAPFLIASVPGLLLAVFMAALYLLGGGLGPIVVGLLSDFFSVRAQQAAGSPVMLELYKAQGLHDAMWVIPVSLVLAALAFSRASNTARHDMDQMAGTPGNS